MRPTAWDSRGWWRLGCGAGAADADSKSACDRPQPDGTDPLVAFRTVGDSRRAPRPRGNGRSALVPLVAAMGDGTTSGDGDAWLEEDPLPYGVSSSDHTLNTTEWWGFPP